MTFFLHCFNLDDPDSPCCLLQTHYYTGNNVILVQRMAEIWRTYAGADPGFQVRGGALKKIAPSRGRRENCWGISCEKSRFYAKKSYFSNFRWDARNVWGISCEKSRFFQFPWYVRNIVDWTHVKIFHLLCPFQQSMAFD